jgi:ketose-bisphosphate aldolase
LIISSKELLQKAKKDNNIVIQSNVTSASDVKAAVHTSKITGSTLMIALAEAHQKYFSLEEFTGITKFYLEHFGVDAVLHFDHGYSVETIEKALKSGCSSVMIDGSSKSFDDNVMITKEVKKMAKKYGASVESEIGHVGSAGDDKENVYTEVKSAQKFAKLTDTDSLAVSVGTSHGVYNVKKPELQFDLIKELSQSLDVPLVLHGGSGTGFENLLRAKKYGINKLNVYTDLIIASKEGMERSIKDKMYESAVLDAQKAYGNCLKEYIEKLCNR